MSLHAVLLVVVLAAAPKSAGADDSTLATPGAADSVHGAGEVASTASEPAVDARGIGGGRIFARARVELPAAPQRVFDIVSDYDRLGDFVSAIDTSRVIGRDATGVLVRQVGNTKLLVHKTVRMTLRFRPEPPERLWFEIVDGDFRTYAGCWRFEPSATGTRLTYDVTFTAPELLPGVLVRHVVERDLRTMLRELGGEVRRRTGATSGTE